MGGDATSYEPAKFHVHVDAIVRRGDEILIMKRAMGLMTGAWYFPGGSLEPGESPEEGGRREVREETGIELRHLTLFRVWHYRQAERIPAVGITFTAEVPPGTEPIINEEHTAARWVTPRDYLERFLNDGVLAALARNAVARELAAAVRDLVTAYDEARP